MLPFRAWGTMPPRAMGARVVGSLDGNVSRAGRSRPSGPQISRRGRRRDAFQDTESPVRIWGKKLSRGSPRRRWAWWSIPPARRAGKPRRMACGGFLGALVRRATGAFSGVTLHGRKPASGGTRRLAVLRGRSPRLQGRRRRWRWSRPPRERPASVRTDRCSRRRVGNFARDDGALSGIRGRGSPEATASVRRITWASAGHRGLPMAARRAARLCHRDPDRPLSCRDGPGGLTVRH